MSPFALFIFFVVLGVLIFVHELGHFVAAKACGIYVDRFSLGMPPRIFGFKWGETDYCIGLLPIGGYVKMAGQEDAPLSDEERETTYGNIPSERWFNNRPLWQRAIVLVAGPFMNLVLAFCIYAFVAAVGEEVPLMEVDTRVGAVQEGSPASTAPMYLAGQNSEPIDFSATPDAIGWETGDRIVSINGKEMTRFRDIVLEAVLGKGKKARVEIQRTSADGVVHRYISPIEPKVLDDDIKAPRFGFAPFTTALIRNVLPGTPAEDNGLLPGDVIIRVQGKWTDAPTFSQAVRALEPDSAIQLEVARGDRIISMTLRTRSQGTIRGMSFSPTLNPLLLMSKDNPIRIGQTDREYTDATKLQEGDVLVSIDGLPATAALLRELSRSTSSEPLDVVAIRPSVASDDPLEGERISAQTTMAQLMRGLTGIDESAQPEIVAISDKVSEKTGLKRRDVLLEIDGQPATIALLRAIEHDRVGEEIPVKVRRPALGFGLVRGEETLDTNIEVASVELIGVVWGTKTVFRRSAPAEVIPAAFAECDKVVRQIGTTVVRLFTGRLSPSMLGGPVMIADVTAQAVSYGFFNVLDIMALISVNLCILNLLPLPVLDGGQLLFVGIEAIRRKPVSVKFAETVGQVGLLLIIGLFVYVTFNDISRVVDRWLP